MVLTFLENAIQSYIVLISALYLIATYSAMTRHETSFLDEDSVSNIIANSMYPLTLLVVLSFIVHYYYHNILSVLYS